MTYIVLGSSASGISAIKEIRQHDEGSEIILVSEDDFIYSRCLLHYDIGNRRSKEKLNFAGDDFFTKYKVCFKPNLSCMGMDTGEKEITLSDGSTLSYDKLFIGTGSSSRLPSIRNIRGANNVLGLRNYKDVEFIKEHSSEGTRVTVLGAGLVGMDAVVGLLERGVKNISLIEFENRVLPKQLDKRASLPYEEALKKRGVSLYLGEELGGVRLKANKDVETLVLNSGKTIDCDLLITTIGVRPNTDFLKGTPVQLDELGLAIDKGGRTNVPNIFGGGDVTGRSPIWPVAVKQGIVGGANMCGHKKTLDSFFHSKATMNFFNINTLAVGNVLGEGGEEEVLWDDGTVYKKVVHKDGKIKGAILQNDIAYGGVLTQLIAHNIDIRKVRKPLFKVDYSDFFNLDENFSFYYKELSGN